MPLPRLSARARQELEKQDAVLLAQPIKADSRVMAAYVRHMVRLTRSNRSQSPSTDAVAFITGVFDRDVAALTSPSAKAAIVCRAGCAYCCTQPVAVTPMEVFALANLARVREAAASITATAEKVQGRSHTETWPRCPLLADNNCAVYPTRPLSCHAFVSLALQDCIKAFVMRDKPAVQCPKTYNEVLKICRSVLFAVLQLRGMPSQMYELNAALARALAAPDSETRWLQGEDVFAGLVPMPVEAELTADIARFAENLAPTL